MLALKKIWNPEQIKPPNWVGEKFSENEGPGLAMRQQAKPGNVWRCVGGIAPNVCEFGGGAARMFFRRSVYGEPHEHPSDADPPDNEECGTPSPTGSDPRH